MLFSTTDHLGDVKGNPVDSETADDHEIHLLARDAKTGELYGLTVRYLLRDTTRPAGGFKHILTVDRHEMKWLFKELKGDRVTHFRLSSSRRQTYRQIRNSGFLSDEIRISGYNSDPRVAVDFAD